LLDRTRQAIYTGLSHKRHYFSAQNAMAVLHDAKRRDSSRIEALIQFIAKNYPASESELILLDQVGYGQVLRVIKDAEEILVVFNGNIDHLAGYAPFTRVLKNLLSSKRQFSLFVPGEWAVGYMEQDFGLPVPMPVVRDDISYLPSFLIARSGNAFRAFFFLRVSVEETRSSEAARLWKHLSPKYEENVRHTSREAVGTG
jgi:hypothetical protein